MANNKFVVKNGLQTQNVDFVSPDQLNKISIDMLNTDTLSVSGNSGQLFSITDSMTGVIYAVNDISGVPSIEVYDSGQIRFAELFGNVLIGTGTDNSTDKVQISGSLLATTLKGNLDWSYIQNKPDPVITLAGDLSGSVTLTDLASGTLTATIAANSVALGTDTTGNYMVDVAAGTGISISHTPGEGSTATITNSAPNVTTDITITHNASTVVVNSSDGTDGTINAATTSLAGVMSSTDKTKLDGIATGATANTGTVTSVSGTGTVAGLSLSGTVTTSGNITLSGTLSTPVSTINDSTTVGQNLVKLTNPAAVTFLRVNADNTVSALDAATFRTAIGAGTSSTTGTVTSVGGTGTVAGLSLSGTVTTSGNLTLSGTLSTPVSTINDSTTVGQNLVKLTNPTAVTFLRVNADNTVSALDADTFRTAIGAGTSSTTGTVTSVSGTGTVNGLSLSGTVTTSGNITLGGTLSVSASDFASQTANTFLAAPNGIAGTPTFRAIVAADIPTLNQNTTGTASNVTGTVAATNGGTGQTSYAVGDILYASTTSALSKLADVATGNALISGGVNTAPAWGKIGLTTHISGTLAVGNGGTGATTLTANNVILGNGTSAVQFVAPSTSGNVLTSNGTTWTSAAAPYPQITNDTTTNGTRYLIFDDVTTGSLSNVGTSSTKLYFNPSTGTLSATLFNSLSDISFKENVQTIENALEKVTSLRGVTFEWKETKNKSIGLIAQEVEQILPEIVTTNENGVKTVSYDAVVPLLVQAIKEQQKIIESMLEVINKK